MLIRCLFAVILLAAPRTDALDWPNFRGPDHNGISRETGWSLREEPKILWRAQIGLGFSTIVVAEGAAITTGHNRGEDTVWCFDAATGRLRWKHSYAAPLGDKYFEGGTTGTPTIHEGRVFHLGRQGEFFCLDLAGGKVIWQRQLARELTLAIPDWGFASSPLVEGDRLILNVGGAGFAVDRHTGQTAWRSDAGMAAYATAVPFDLDGARCAAILTQRECVAVEAATGKVRWRRKFVSGYDTSAGAPVIHDGALLISAYNVPAVKLNLGDGSPAREWKTDTRVHFNAGAVIDGHYYAFHGEAGKKGGELRCLDWKTGATRWAQTGLGVGSLIAADGKLICLGETGELAVVEASPERFKALARAQILGGKCWITPALANGRLYVRNSKGQLVCVEMQ